MSALLVLLFVLLALCAVPVAFAMLGATAGVLLLEGRPLAVLVQRLYSPTQSFPMLAVPFFVLAGHLMMSGTLGQHLVDLARLFVGRLRGGLAQVSVVGSVVFGGVSGSAVADASAMGAALIPVQLRAGYPAPFAAAVNAASSTIAVLIPPSIPLILYGLVANVSIVDLFVAGVLPGVLLAVAQIALVAVQARRLSLPRSPLPGGGAALRGRLLAVIPALLMPVFVVGTLRFGLATPTEVSVMAVAYALLVSALVYRDLTLRRLTEALRETARTTGVVLFVIMASATVQWVFTAEQVPQRLAAALLGSLSEPWAVVLVLNAVMLVVGTVLDLPAAILLLGPLFVGIAGTIGVDPVQLGIVMVLNLAVGLYTPPVGTTLFISAALAGCSIGAVARALMPFYLVAVAIVLLFSFVPALVLY